MRQPAREQRPLASVLVTVAVLAGLIGVVMVGGATASPALAMVATGHWVYNAASRSAQHVDGGTTAVDAQVAVPTDGSVYMTLQGDRGGFVVTQGDVTAFTKSDLTVAGGLGISSPERPFGIETLGGPYLAYGTTGSIVRLGLKADTIEVGGPFTAPVITSDGTLWLHRTDNGSVCSLAKDALLVSCGDSADGNGTLTVLDDKPAWVSTDRDTARLVAPATTGAQPVPLGVDLPAGALIADRDLDGVLAALDPKVASLSMLDVSGVAANRPGKLASPTVMLPAGQYDAPMATGGAVAVLDHTTNSLQTFDRTGKQLAIRPVPVDAQGLTRGQDGQLYLDDATGTRTNVVSETGAITDVHLGPSTSIAIAAPPQLVATVRPPPLGGARKPLPTSGGGTTPPPDGGGNPSTPPGPRPTAPPGPPGNVDVKAGDAQAIVSWTASDPGAATYIVDWAPAAVPAATATTAPDAVGAVAGSVTVPATSLTTAVTGLVNGAAYVVTVTGENEIGRSRPTTSGSFSPSGTVPGTPTGLSAGGIIPGAVMLTWQPPADNGVAVANYVIETRTAQGTSFTTTTGSTEPKATISSGLVLGTVYTFTVAAMTAGNVAGPATAETPGIQVFTSPDPPKNVALTSGDRRLDLTWETPDSMGGNDFKQYRVEIAGHPELVPTITGTGATWDGNLVNGTAYTVTVATVVGNDRSASTPQGLSLTSDVVSRTATPSGRPTAQILSATASGVHGATVRVAVDNNGGGASTCKITFNGRLNTFNCGGTQNFSIDDLAYSTTYTVVVTPENSVGAGSPSNSVQFRTNDAPVPPPTTDPPAPPAPPAPPPPPAKPDPSVSVSKGAPVNRAECTDPSCAGVRVSLQNFDPGISVSVSCYSTKDDTASYTYSVTTDGNGSNTSEQCFFGYPGASTWAVAGGTESGHLTW